MTLNNNNFKKMIMIVNNNFKRMIMIVNNNFKKMVMIANSNFKLLYIVNFLTLSVRPDLLTLSFQLSRDVNVLLVVLLLT